MRRPKDPVVTGLVGKGRLEQLTAEVAATMAPSKRMPDFTRRGWKYVPEQAREAWHKARDTRRKAR
jgi:hypothetical protein